MAARPGGAPADVLPAANGQTPALAAACNALRARNQGAAAVRCALACAANFYGRRRRGVGGRRLGERLYRGTAPTSSDSAAALKACLDAAVDAVGGELRRCVSVREHTNATRRRRLGGVLCRFRFDKERAGLPDASWRPPGGGPGALIVLTPTGGGAVPKKTGPRLAVETPRGPRPPRGCRGFDGGPGADSASVSELRGRQRVYASRERDAVAAMASTRCCVASTPSTRPHDSLRAT